MCLLLFVSEKWKKLPVPGEFADVLGIVWNVENVGIVWMFGILNISVYLCCGGLSNTLFLCSRSLGI